MEWTSDVLESGVRERAFAHTREGRRIPGVLWQPEAAPRGLVLVGHGASGHKRMTYVLAVARRLCRRHGLAAVAIDGPVHGDRRADPDAPEADVFKEYLRIAPQPEVTDGMVADWTATLDVVQALEGFAALPVGYWGLSMGTSLGLPFVAQEPRVRAAALGLMGVRNERLGQAAERLRCPVLFLVQWDDELIARDSALALFDRLGSPDKTLHASPGKHVAVPQAEVAATESFLAMRLVAAEADAG